jgi:hypothetical protein
MEISSLSRKKREKVTKYSFKFPMFYYQRVNRRPIYSVNPKQIGARLLKAKINYSRNCIESMMERLQLGEAVDLPLRRAYT